MLVVLSSLRKQAEQAMRSKPVSSTPPWSLHQLLPLGSCPVWVPVLTSFSDEQWGITKPFLSRLALVMVFCRNSKPNMTVLFIALWMLSYAWIHSMCPKCVWQKNKNKQNPKQNKTFNVERVPLKTSFDLSWRIFQMLIKRVCIMRLLGGIFSRWVLYSLSLWCSITPVFPRE